MAPPTASTATRAAATAVEDLACQGVERGAVYPLGSGRAGRAVAGAARAAVTTLGTSVGRSEPRGTGTGTPPPRDDEPRGAGIPAPVGADPNPPLHGAGGNAEPHCVQKRRPARPVTPQDGQLVGPAAAGALTIAP